MTRPDLVDIEVEIIAETEKAVFVFDGKTKLWLPKSQVEIAFEGAGLNVKAIVTMTQGLAREKGLI